MSSYFRYHVLENGRLKATYYTLELVVTPVRLACFSKRQLALLAEFRGWANWFEFQVESMVGMATADRLQSFPSVSTMWDVGLNFAKRGVVLCFLVIMHVMYLAGIYFIFGSRASRRWI